MNKKRIILLISALLLLTFSLLLSSCGKNKSYTVSLDPNGGALASPTVEVKFSESYLLPTPTLPGYTFTGWYHDETKVETYGVWSIENDIDLVAQWELTNFQITTTLNGGTLDIDLPSTYTMNSEDIQLAAPVKENHIFLYWKDQNNNTYDGDFVIEDAVDGVILQHVGQIIRIEQVVDADDLDVIAEIFNRRAEDHTADTAEPVDTDFNHCFTLFFSWFGYQLIFFYKV